MTESRLRELEWAAAYLTTHKPPPRCRCNGSCSRCGPYYLQESKLNPKAVLELINRVKDLETELEGERHR